MKTKKHWNLLVLILLFVLEIFFFKRIDPKCNTFTSLLIVLGIPLLLSFLFLILKKDFEIIKHAVVLVVKGGASSLAGILLVIFFLIHIGWLSDSLIDYFQGKDNLPIILKILSFLIIPFLINALLYKKPLLKVVPNELRDILITALSHNKKENVKLFIDYNFDKTLIEQQKVVTFWNWYPIINILDNYTGIKTLLVIYSKEVLANLESDKEENARALNAFELMIKSRYKEREISIIPIVILEMNIFDELFNELKFKIEKQIGSIEDEKVLFGVSSGTALTTASLVFLSMRGQRGLVYQKQDGSNELDEFTVDVLTIQELWDEIIERY